MLQKLHFISFLLTTLLFRVYQSVSECIRVYQSVSATFEQRLRSIRKQYPRVHPYEPTNQDVNQLATNNNIIDNPQASIQTLNHLPLIQQPPSRNKNITGFPEEILKSISDNLDSKSNIKLGATSALFKNITMERNDETKRNLEQLKMACGNFVYWSLIQDGYSIFESPDANRVRSIEEHESCIRAIILNHQIVKNRLKRLTIANSRGVSFANKTVSYLESLQTLFNKIDHLESITIQAMDDLSLLIPHSEHELLLSKIISRLKVDSVDFIGDAVSNIAFAQFTRDSTLRFLAMFDMNLNQTSQFQNLRNLESLTLSFYQREEIDFSLLPHLRHVSIDNSFMNADSIFSRANNITSIHSAFRRNQDLESSLSNTEKQITSLTFFNKREMERDETSLSFNLFTKFISSSKHTTIFLVLDMHEDFNHFLQDSTVLESISVHKNFPSNSLEFLCYAHGIKYFELYDYFLTDSVDPNLIHFIERQTNLHYLTFITYNYQFEYGNVMLHYLDLIVNAILVQKTVKALNLRLEIEFTSKIEFTQSFYKCLLKLENLDLTLNGVPIKNVLRDLRVIDDSVFHLDEGVFRVRLSSGKVESIY